MDGVLLAYNRVTSVINYIRAYRRRWDGLWPILSVVGHGDQIVRVIHQDEGEPIVLYGTQLVPVYADFEARILAPGLYRGVVLLLIRRQHHFYEVLEYGDVVLTTFRAEEYAWTLLAEFGGSGSLNEIIWTAARLLHTTWIPRNLLFRKYMAGTTIAADATIVVTGVDGEPRPATFSQKKLATLNFFEGDRIEVILNKPHAAIILCEKDALSSELVGWNGAEECNLFVVGIHGILEREQRLLLWTLVNHPEMKKRKTRLFIISDLDVGGLRIGKACLVGSSYAPTYAMPDARRLGLTGRQLDQDCSGCMRRRLEPRSVEEASNMLSIPGLDEQTLEDAAYIVKHGRGAHVESLQWPSRTATRAAGKRGMVKYLTDLIKQQL